MKVATFWAAVALLCGCIPDGGSSGGDDDAGVTPGGVVVVEAPCLEDVPDNPCAAAVPYAINVGEVADAAIHGAAFVTCVGGEPTAITCIDVAQSTLSCHATRGAGPTPHGLPMCDEVAGFGRVLLAPLVPGYVSHCDRNEACVSCDRTWYEQNGSEIYCDATGAVEAAADTNRYCEWFGYGTLRDCGDAMAPVYDVPHLR